MNIAEFSRLSMLVGQITGTAKALEVGASKEQVLYQIYILAEQIENEMLNIMAKDTENARVRDNNKTK